MSIDNEPQIQEIDSDDSGDESTNIHNPSGKTLNRAEKKTRKAISKLGLRPYDGSASGTGKIIRVTVKKQKNILFVISNPDVYKSPSDNTTFIIFGEARIEDLSSSNNALRGLANAGKGAGGAGPNAAAMANLMQAMGGLGGAGAGGASGAGAGGALGALPDSDETEPSSEDKKEESSDVKVEDKDIELIVTQVGCTKEKAIAALKKHNNDIVEAIMSFNV